MTETISMTLRRETEAAKSLLASYAAILDDDEDARADAIEGETDLNEAIQAGVARIIELDAIVESAKAAAKRISERVKRFENQQNVIRAALGVALDIAGKTRHECDLATISIKRLPPAVQITSEADIPSQYWVAQDPKLDKRAMLKALKDGQEIAGASLDNGGSTVQITTR